MDKKIQEKIYENISTFDILLGMYLLLRNKIKWFFNFQNAFQNYFSVIRNFQNNSYPIFAILKNGSKINLSSKNEVSLYSLLFKNKNCNYSPETDSAIIKLSDTKKSIKLFGIKRNFDTILAFEDETYTKIPIQDFDVVDIGTSIGDTPILFAINGASRVIGLEPFPQNFDLAKKNIQENNFEDKVHLIRAGCGASDGLQYVDTTKESDMRSQINSSQNGIEIPIMSIESIVEKFNIQDGILKVDCEGCEYDAILSSKVEILRKFQFIQVEYHYGYKNLKNKLENSGFTVELTKLESYFQNGKMEFFRGHLNATRQC